MKRVRLFLIGLFAALLPALMAPTGGFPSLLNVQGIQASGKKNCGSDTASICATSTASAHDRWSLALRPGGGAGNILGEIITCSGNSTDTCLRVDTAAGTSFKIDGAGTMTGVPNTAYGVVNPNGANCSGGVTAPIKGFSATCTHTGTGTYQFTFSPAFTAPPICVATVTGALFFVTVSTTAATGLVTTFNTGFTVADTVGAVQVFCALG